MKSIIDIFEKLAGNGRYIKLDGSAYHSGPVRSFFERPEAKIGLAALALNTAIHMVGQNSAEPGGLVVLHKFVGDALFTLLGLGIAHLTRTTDFRVSPGFKDPIDRAGTDLSQRQLTLRESQYLDITKKVSQNMFMFMSLGTGAAAVLVGEVVMVGAILAAYHFDRANTAAKLLGGQYVFCDKPPAKEAKVTREAPTGGKLSHNNI
ncbi:MAG: hypothetical protein MRY79_09410 [Alphaproteobacteria bacterium]|nr:hypothetical protein [Alphaproteobacteria bacterium]